MKKISYETFHFDVLCKKLGFHTKLELLDAHQTYLYRQASYILNHEKKICEKPEVMLISLSFHNK